MDKISSKIPETKGNISYNMLRILAEYASENRILDLVLPFKEVDISIQYSGLCYILHNHDTFSSFTDYRQSYVEQTNKQSQSMFTLHHHRLDTQ